MFVIRRQQMEAFNQATRAAFEDEMAAHSQEFSPRLCQVIGEEQLRVALRRSMDRATTYGFTLRGPVRLYIELMFLCGSGFDTDPQYPAMGQVLRASGDQMQRAEQIYEGVLDYRQRVPGPDNTNVRKSLEYLSDFARRPVAFSPDDFQSVTLREITSAFPQKAAYVGEGALINLIREGRAEARKYGLDTPRAEALVVVLMFAFGHGCTDDPLYPWISRTLKDERIVGPQARAKRLEKKALTWLDHVLARPQEGAQA
jgi:hypothetical protein